MQAAAAVVSKGEFASLTNVTPTRVGQWIREKKISGDAIVGDGRFARINVEVAMRQLGDRRDPGQATGNGLETRLTFAPSTAPRQEPEGDGLADQLKTARLRSLQYANARAAEEALARRGVYVRAEVMGAAVSRGARKMQQVYEGGYADFAAKIAGKFGLDRHELLHLARTDLRPLRFKAWEAMQREAAEHQMVIEDLVADATDPAAGEA